MRGTPRSGDGGRRTERALAGAKARPWLERREGSSRFRYDRPGTPVRKFADALAARALLEEIAAGRWSRFGRCDAGPCRCVFIDRTRSGVRRYCSDSAPTVRRTRRSGAARPAPNFLFVISSEHFEV